MRIKTYKQILGCAWLTLGAAVVIFVGFSIAASDLARGSESRTCQSAFATTNRTEPFSQYENLSPADPEWLRLSVRSVNDPIVDPGYLARLHASVHQVFKPYFEKSGYQDLSFEALLEAQHRVVVAGLSGTEKYQGASRRDHNIQTNYHVTAGRLLYKFVAPEFHVSFSFRFRDRLSGDALNRVSQLSSIYLATKPGDAIQEPSGSITNPISGNGAVVYGLDLPGLGPDVRIRNDVYGDFVTHHYPPPATHPKILLAMEKTLSQVRAALSDGSPIRGRARERLLRTLADYVYLGANTHMFDGANFSLIMAQANFILARSGLRGISHGQLDYIAMTNSYSYFRTHFRNEIAKANPGLLTQPSRAKAPLSEKRVAVDILAHFANTGDQSFKDGQLISDNADETGGNWIEGLRISPLGWTPGMQVTYAVIDPRYADEYRSMEGEFAGSRGRSEPLRGLRIGLSGPNASQYELTYLAKFSVSGWSQPLREDEAAVSPSDSETLVGLKIWLRHVEKSRRTLPKTL